MFPLGIGQGRREIGLANFHDVPRQVVERASQILNGVSGKDRDAGGNVSDRSEVIKGLACLRVAFSSNFIRVRVKEGADLDIQITEMFFGPFGLQ